jgi:tripartite-type tricarboxylate transporter receptor subunit TctC
MERYLPGATIVVENVPGAGHIIATNRLFASAPDGLTIGTFNTGLIYAQLLGLEGVRFDLRELSWIGKAASDPRVLVVGQGSGLASIEDLRASGTPIVFGTTGIGSASHNDLALLKTVLGLNVKLVPGYSGQELQLAMLRDELQGTLGSYSSLRSFVEHGYGAILLRIGGDRVPGLADIPEAAAFVPEGGDGRRLIDVVRANAELGRLTAGPPGISEDRLEVLLAAYRGALEDPELLAEATKLGRPIEPAFGLEVEARITAALDLPDEVVRSLSAAIACSGGDADGCPPAE